MFYNLIELHVFLKEFLISSYKPTILLWQ